MRFCGNEICCGSYACLNAIQDDRIDIQLFELSTTAPFGVSYFENEYFDRLLTTFCDPNQGLDDALRLWGYQSERFDFNTPRSTVQAIQDLFSLENWSIVLGPIDMGHLGYQIMPKLLERMDHYITLRSGKDGIILITDSEGIYNYPVTAQELEGWISVEDVLEAKGKITLRRIHKVQDSFSKKYIIEQTCKNALRNLKKAEAEGQGSRAVERCCELLVRSSCYRWRLPFLYDLQYLQQRKWLTYQLFQQAQDLNLFDREILETIRKIVKQQSVLLGELYYELDIAHRLSEEKLLAVGNGEWQLSDLRLK